MLGCFKLPTSLLTFFMFVLEDSVCCVSHSLFLLHNWLRFFVVSIKDSENDSCIMSIIRSLWKDDTFASILKWKRQPVSRQPGKWAEGFLCKGICICETES